MRKLGIIFLLASLLFLILFLCGLVIPNWHASANQKEKVNEFLIEGSKHKEVKSLLYVPSFGDNYVMPIVDSISQDVLDSGVVGNYDNGTAPGGRGNYILLGHRVTHGEPFKNLPELKPGDDIIVDQGDKEFIYEVAGIEKLDEVVYSNTNRRQISLITCASYFVHTDERIVVTGLLKDVNV